MFEHGTALLSSMRPHRRLRRRRSFGSGLRAAIGISVALLAVLAVGLVSARAAAAAPTIYHSPDDDGEPATEPLEIPPSQSVTLHLYIDGGPATSTGAVCSAGTGDELCGWTLRLQGAAGLSISSFTPSAGATSHLEAGILLGVVGGDPWRGQRGPVKIGDVVVQGPTDARLDLLASEAIDASLSPIAMSPDTIATVPEPGFAIGLASGLLLLRALGKRRRERVTIGPAAVAAMALVSATPDLARAQTTPVCGDVIADDVLDVQDLDAIRDFLAGDPGAPDLAGDPDLRARCDVDSDGLCETQDWVRIRRYMLDMPGGMDAVCTAALPGSVVLPAPTVEQASTFATTRASVSLSGTVRFPSVRVTVAGGYGRFAAQPDESGAWETEVPLRFDQSNALTVKQDFGAGYESASTTIVVDQTSAAGTSSLDGRVVDAATGEPIAQSISIDVSGITHATDDAGRFEIDGLPEGRVFVTATAPGYAPEIATGYAGAFVRPAEDADLNRVELTIGLTPRAAPITIDSAGGTVMAGSGAAELIVPAGSLASPTEISLTALPGSNSPNLFGRPIVEIGPGPVVFDPPATLRIPAGPAPAGTTADLVQVDHTDGSVVPIIGTVDGTAHLEIPISSSNGDSLFFEYSTTFVPLRTSPTTTTIVIPFVGSCTETRDQPVLLSPTDFIFLPSSDADVDIETLGSLSADPRQIKSGVPKVLGGLGSIQVPQGEAVVYEFTVDSFTQFERVFQFSLSGQPTVTEVGILQYDVPQQALPDLVSRIPLPCPRPVAKVWGDPHLIRFDHVGEAIPGSSGNGRYDFQASGEFVLFESIQDAMVVQARFEPLPANPNVTITTMAAMDVAGARMTVKRNATALDVRIEGALTPLMVGVPVALPGGGEVERLAPGTTQDQLVVRWPDGSTVHVSLLTFLGSQYLNVHPELATARFGQVQGLLGNANGILDDDLNLRDGTPANPAELYTTYTDSWRISQAESLFDYVPFEDTTTYNGTPLAPFVADDLDPAVRAAAEATCIAAGITEEPLLDDCVLDVALLGTGAADGALETLDQIPDVGTYVAVSAQASIFQAGQSAPVDLGGGGGAGLLPTEFALAPGTGRSMRVLDRAGNVSFSPGAAAMPVDGLDYGDLTWGSWGGVAGPRLRRMGQLMGVFLDSGLPSPIPASFDCGDFDGEFSAPAIGQVFCIGDGLSFANEPQTFLVPDAATRLFLGHAERLSNQVIESAVHHLGDNYGTGGLFALAPNPEGVGFTSNPFDLPTGFTPSSGRVRLDLAGTDIGGNSIWVNGQRIAYLPITGADATTWREDLAFTIDPSILLPTGNTIYLRSNGGNLDDFLFQNLRFEVAPPVAVLPEPSDLTPYHLGDLQGQFIGDGVGSGDWGLFANMPTPYDTFWTSPPFDVASPETLGGASVVIDIAQTDRGNNLVLVNGTAIGSLPIRPDGTVWSTDEEIGFDPALLKETGNTIQVRSGYLVVGLVEVDDFMMRNARLAVAPEAAVPPGGYSDNAGIHELIIDVGP